MNPIVIDLKTKQEVIKTKKGYQPESQVIERTRLLILERYSIESICKEFKCTPGCIEGHVIKLVEWGKLNVHQFLSLSKYDAIEQAIDCSESTFLKDIKKHLPEEISYFEINLVKADQLRIKQPQIF